MGFPSPPLPTRPVRPSRRAGPQGARALCSLLARRWTGRASWALRIPPPRARLRDLRHSPLRESQECGHRTANGARLMGWMRATPLSAAAGPGRAQGRRPRPPGRAPRTVQPGALQAPLTVRILNPQLELGAEVGGCCFRPHALLLQVTWLGHPSRGRAGGVAQWAYSGRAYGSDRLDFGREPPVGFITPSPTGCLWSSEKVTVTRDM